MRSNISLRGNNISLVSMTNILWHTFYTAYVNDPMMDSTPYTYNAERVEAFYQLKAVDDSRMYFAILLEDAVIGNIYLKHIDYAGKKSEFGIALVHDGVKGKGYGFEAIGLLKDYAFHTLGIHTLLADTVHRNTRSQHVLEKAGFTYTHEDADFKYYACTKKISALYAQKSTPV